MSTVNVLEDFYAGSEDHTHTPWRKGLSHLNITSAGAAQ